MTNRDYVARTLELAIRGLSPIVTEVLAPLIPAGTSWVDVLEARDRSNGVRGRTYGPNDLSALLQMMTERLGTLGYPFTDILARTGQRLASELREVRNRWAHHDEFDDDETWRAIDTTERLLKTVGADAIAVDAANLKSQLRVAPVIDIPAPPEAALDQSHPDIREDAAPSVVDDRERGDPARPALTIELMTVPVLSYAAAHNRIPVISSITITNTGPALREAVLKLEATHALGRLDLSSEHLVDLAADASITLTDETLLLDPARMLAVEERRPAAITAAIEYQGDTLATTRADVELLAAHQWVSAPLHLSLELLATFVMPNHPAVATLLGEASEVLLARTGSGSLEGYQAGTERVDEIAEAIFEAMRGRRIRYSEPPASWGDRGQKIRTPGEVLDGRVGTCLDTTVVMAAALEQAGIRPMLWLVEGHAFVGYWRDEVSVGAAALTDARELANYVDLGLLALIESTLVTERPEPAAFAEAIRSPVVEYLDRRPDAVLGVTDVYSARHARIFPLPARTEAPDGSVVVTEYRPATAEQRQYEEYEKTAVKDAAGLPVVPFRVSQWKNSLLDLSLRNRLINFSERGRLNMAVPASDVSHLEDLVNDGKAISLVPSDAVAQIQRERGIRFGRDLPEADRTALLRDKSAVFADVTDAAYTTRLRALAYKARTIEEETGANNLYLAFGTLVWTFNDRELRSPLVLVPVKLIVGRGGSYQIGLDDTGTSTPNYCLLEKLRQVHGLGLPGLAEPAEDGAGIDLDAAFRSTRESLAIAGLPYRVESTVDLSILQFAKFRLWKDLDENWAELAKNALVKHLIETPNEPFADPHGTEASADLDELAARCPVPADSSQLAAVAAAVADQTFVLEGPPGTGKSQTITNLLVRAVAEGKRVLFVAEKRAALDVVQRRLDEVGLGAFALDLHDKGSRPAAVRAQIKSALAHRASADRDGLRTELDTLNGARRTLARYAGRLHEPNAAGLSLYSARNKQLAAVEDTPVMELPASVVTAATSDELATLRSTLSILPDFAEPARPRRDHPWSFVDGRQDASFDASAILSATRELDEAITAVPRVETLQTAVSWVTTGSDAAHLAHLATAPRYELGVVDAARTPAWSTSAAEAVAALNAFLAVPRQDLEGIDPRFIELPLTEIHRSAQEADASKYFGRNKRRLAVRDSIAGVLAPSVLPKPKNLSALTGRLLEWQSRVVALRSMLATVPGLAQVPSWNPLLEPSTDRVESDRRWVGWLAGALKSDHSVFSGELVEAARRWYSTSSSDKQSALALTRLASAVDAVAASIHSDPSRLSRSWAAEERLIPRWTRMAAARDVDGAGPAALGKWIALVSHLAPLSALGLEVAERDILSGQLDSESALAAFEKGLATTSIAERASTTTLDAFVPSAHNRVIRRFTDAAGSVREHLVTTIPADLLERRAFDPMAPGGQVGELRRQLERQRGGLGVRALLERYGDLITDLIPCILMSPESVARFFAPRSELFDIVVFDEASQVRVADAIGAIGRSRSVVVVGDSKQMPPTSFAETSSKSDDAETTVTDVMADEESILSECVTSRVPARALTWHYRSQDESLISFSNEHYYGNLSSFPSPLHGTKDDSISGHGISLVRVNGSFLRRAKGKELRTNPVEAEAIVDEIERRFHASPETLPSVGVVTFNAPQRSLIEAMLRDSGNSRIVEALENSKDGLFVKNLENVQGDERDAILFSVAFSADENGRLPLNFGPISQAGGERRLNVAITRARRQVILYSSFDPHELRAEESTSTGLKHLRAYLELAAGEGHSSPSARFRDETVDRHREEIAAGLRGRGYSVTTDVGLSDFRVDLSVAAGDEPDRPIAAILLDHSGWARRRTVSDRDELPVSVLGNLMRWPAVSRIWLPEWLAAREEAMDRVVGEIEHARLDVGLEEVAVDIAGPEPIATDVDPARPRPSEVFARSAAAAEAPSVAAPPARKPPSPRETAETFVPWRVRRAGNVAVLDRLPAPDARAQVASIIRDVVEAEGPVHLVRLAKLVGGAFGLDRVAQGRAASILRCLPAEFRVHSDPFAWPTGAEVGTWTTFRRTADSAVRPFEHVHPAEVVNAMAYLCVRGAGMYEDELRRESLGFFGVQRMTPKMVALLDAALQRGVATGRLERLDSGLIAARIS